MNIFKIKSDWTKPLRGSVGYLWQFSALFSLHGNIQVCIIIVVARRFKAMSKQEVLL